MGRMAGVDYNSELCVGGFDRSKDRLTASYAVEEAPEKVLTPAELAEAAAHKAALAEEAAKAAAYWANHQFLTEGGWEAAVARAVAHHGYCPSVVSAAFRGRVTKREIALWKEIKDDLEKGCQKEVITAEWLDDFFDDWIDA